MSMSISMSKLKKSEDTSVKVFYEELLNKILEDPCENSYSEFNYEFKIISTIL